MKLQNLQNLLSVLNIFYYSPQLVKNSTSFRIYLNEVTKLINLSYFPQYSCWLPRNYKKFYNLEKNVEVIQNIYKPESHSGASKTFEKCLGPSGTPKSLLEVYKRKTFWTLYNFLKIFRRSMLSRCLLEVIQKYLQAWMPFRRFYNFWKNV